MMIRLPTRTLFRLLTVGIALMVVVLMAMVGFILYQAFSARDPIVADAPVIPQVTPEPWRTDSALNSSNALHRILHPEIVVEAKPKDAWGSAVANHGGYRLIGTISSGEGSHYVWLQNERTRDPVTLRVGQEKNGMTAVKIDLAKSQAAVTIGGETKLMSRQDALVAAQRPAAAPRPAPAAAGRPGATPAAPAGRAASPGVQAAPTGSIRVISGGGGDVSTTNNVAVDAESGQAATGDPRRGGRTEEQWRSEISERLRRDMRARTTR